MLSAMVSASLRAGTTATTRGQTGEPRRLPIVALGAKPEGAAGGDKIEPDQQGIQAMISAIGDPYLQTLDWSAPVSETDLERPRFAARHS